MKNAALLAMITLSACGSSNKAAPPPQSNATVATQTTASTPPQPVSPNVNISGDILTACKIVFQSSPDAPKFDTDKDELLPEDMQVLDQVAVCLTTGPLKGRAVQLVGRADSRGTEQYNLALGGHRAHQVDDYLHKKGVTSSVSETSRGALDATGHDEATMKTDRRVDLVLVAGN